MKKKSKKDKKSRKKNFINELETVTYEQQILDNNRQLARLRSRNEELEVEAEKLKEKLTQLEENKADLTSHLQRVLQKKTEEAQELQERLIALEKLRREEQQAFKKKEEMMEYEYKTMENNLTAEIKLAAGKLNALEDWRLSRIDLMNKFEQQEKQMAEQEIRHKEILYETEKKVIIGKAKMQNELEKRLTQLADSFREATNLRLGDATQRAVRENIALNQELNALLSHCSELDARLEEYKEAERIQRLQASLYEAEAKLALEKVMKQNQKIERLATEHRRMVQAIGRAQRAEAYAARGDRVLEETQRSCAEAKEKARLLEQHVQVSREAADDTAREARDDCREIQRLARIIAEAKNAIKEALQVHAEVEDTGSEEDACSSCFVDVKEKLLHSLLDILASYQESTIEQEEESGHEPESMETLYEFGNLGLIPIPINADVQRINKIDTVSRDSDTRISLQEEHQQSTIIESSFSTSECSCD